MTVVFPKLPEGQRWYVTEPKNIGNNYYGWVKVQTKFLGIWWTRSRNHYFPRIGGLDWSITSSIKDFHAARPEDNKYVGPH